MHEYYIPFLQVAHFRHWIQSLSAEVLIMQLCVLLELYHYILLLDFCLCKEYFDVVADGGKATINVG